MTCSYSHYVLDCLGPDLPGTFLVQTGPIIAEDKDDNSSSIYRSVIKVLDNNDALNSSVQSTALPRIQKIDIPVGSNSNKRIVKGKLYFPPNLRKSEFEKYPLVLHTYGGPGYQLVLDQWKVDFSSYLASSLGFVVLEVDGRGSGGRGRSHLTSIKGRLGDVEVKDQVLAVDSIKQNYSFIDFERVAVTGVSYGGYVTIRILTDEKTTDFKCGVAVSPVVDWRFYGNWIIKAFIPAFDD